MLYKICLITNEFLYIDKQKPVYSDNVRKAIKQVLKASSLPSGKIIINPPVSIPEGELYSGSISNVALFIAEEYEEF